MNEIDFIQNDTRIRLLQSASEARAKGFGELADRIVAMAKNLTEKMSDGNPNFATTA